MKGILARFLLAALCSAALLKSAARGQEAIEGLAGVVNKRAITLSDVRELVAPKERHARATLTGEALVAAVQEIRQNAINDLIDRSLILQEFDTQGLTIPPHLLDERVQAVIRDSFAGDRQAFIRTLTAQGITLGQYRQTQRDGLAEQEMRRQAIPGVTTITERQARDYYQTHAADFTVPAAVKLNVITLPAKTGPTGHKALEDVRAKVTQGAAFLDLAGALNNGESPLPEGELGWVDANDLDSRLAKAAFALKPGELSPVLEADGNPYLLQCEDRRTATVRSFDEVFPEIEKALLQEERQKQQQEWLLKLRKKAYIKIY